MADAYTTTGSVTLDQTAYDLAIRFPLRAQMFYDQLADVQPTRQSFRGATVVFNLMTEMSPATTPLSETVDVDAVAIANTTKSVTLDEYGNAVITSAKIRAFSMVELNPAVANLVGFNAAISLDTLVSNVLMTGTTVTYVGQTSRAALTAANTLTAAMVRRQRKALIKANVMPKGGDGTLFAAFINPDVAYDLQSETGSQGWRDPHVYSSPGEIWSGEIGAFEGFRFMETPRAPMIADAGAGSLVDVYATLFMGQEALAKAYSTEDGNGPLPRVILGPVVDKLMRFRPVSWYWMGGYNVFRQEALRRVESASSIGANT